MNRIDSKLKQHIEGENLSAILLVVYNLLDRERFAWLDIAHSTEPDTNLHLIASGRAEILSGYLSDMIEASHQKKDKGTS